jgi:hypothetical protein
MTSDLPLSLSVATRTQEGTLYCCVWNLKKPNRTQDAVVLCCEMFCHEMSPAAGSFLLSERAFCCRTTLRMLLGSGHPEFDFDVFAELSTVNPWHEIGSVFILGEEWTPDIWINSAEVVVSQLVKKSFAVCETLGFITFYIRQVPNLH